MQDTEKYREAAQSGGADCIETVQTGPEAAGGRENPFETERYLLATERLREICTEEAVAEPFRSYFQRTAGLILDRYEIAYALYKTGDDAKKSGGSVKAAAREAACDYKAADSGAASAYKEETIEALMARNDKLYSELLPNNYETSYANPSYAVKILGEEFGQLLCMLYAELRGLIVYAYEGDAKRFLVFAELFLQIYGYFAVQDTPLPSVKEVKDCLYWFYSDYSELFFEDLLRQQLGAVKTTAKQIIMRADLTDLRYLYAFGEYVSDNELKTAAYLNLLSQEQIDAMAHTMSEGYRIGFETTGKDLSKKKTVELYCHLGFERVTRQVIRDFEAMGLNVTVCRSGAATVQNHGGFEGADPNPQFAFDHKADKSIYLDKRYMERQLGARKNVFESLKEIACLYGGPAVQEVFGEKPFTPESKAESCRYTDKQQKLLNEWSAQSSLLSDKYIHLNETSFTIIAYPLPEIGDSYEEIFNEIVKINTLDYMKYRRIQQCLIDALDEGVSVHIAGKGDNCTDLTVALHTLADPTRQTNFENCVADVNIPVGEVFTSPQLAGTNGTLFVTGVYLNGLYFENLRVEFKDGMTSDYACTNFETEEENRKYIKDNVLAYHDTLPMGEFAIGTNTTAYMAARRFDIADKLPILIAEKTGPHFALGDTCYSHEEDTATYNPDGKEIVARENECSVLRKTDPSKAYFHTHTDITIPYDELACITVIHADGSQTDLIVDGRFVLPGTEELNEALDGNA